MFFFESIYLRAQRAAERHATLVIVIYILLFVSATAGVQSLRLDMSFRPLFASGAEIAAPTLEFEQTFGQASGAWIAVILENTDATVPEFVRTAARLSERAANLPQIAEVLSLTALQIPNWTREELSFVSPIPAYLLDPEEEEELEFQYETLLDGTRFVNWLVSEDGSKLLLAARLDPPLENLAARRVVVDAFDSLIRSELPAEIKPHFSGVSVVELAYEKQVLQDQVLATAITSLALMLLLYWTFGTMMSVVICLMPVALAIPATLGLMGWLGQPVTIINTAIPAIILAIGVADAVHMLTAWLEARGEGADLSAATRRMLSTTGKACFFTTVTTMGGFLALLSARLESVGSFGFSVAIGIFVAWITNQVMLPWLLRRVDAGSGFPGGIVNRTADAAINRSIHSAIQHPGAVVAGGLMFAVVCALMIPRLDIDQYFNEELPANHPISVSQDMFERDFGGFLGPEISIQRHDGSPLLDDDTLQRLGRFSNALHTLENTRQVWSIRDVLPRQVAPAQRARALDAMRASPAIAQRVHELIRDDNRQLAMLVRIGDVGTQRAGEYRDEIELIAAEFWGDAYKVEIVGQWWLAQHGMRLLLSDMLISLLTAMLIVMPLMWFALRQARLFFAAVVTNLLPLLLPLAFMAATGITLRVGTAVVLAIALGIVVDNTLHIIIRVRAQTESAGETEEQVDLAMRGTGRAVIFTTLALVGGFLSMMTNQLLAIRDMGLVAAVTITGAMLADILFLPALYILCARKRS